MRLCPKCKTEKEIDEFYNDKNRKDKHSCWCKECCKKSSSKNKNGKNYPESRKKWYENNPNYNNKYREKNRDKINKRTRDWNKKYPEKRKNTDLKYSYGLTLIEFNELLAKQDNRCAICSNLIKGRNIHTDHNHITGKVRGLLCKNCNLGIGLFKDNFSLLIRAADYIKRIKSICV